MIARSAIERLVNHPNPTKAKKLFNPRERAQLAEALAATLGTANLLGRARIRLRQQAAIKAHESGRRKFSEDPTDFSCFDEPGRDIRPMAPEKAVAYFRGLVPSLGTDPQRFGEQMRRRAFTLAAATEDTLLGRCQDLISRALETGEGASTGRLDIANLLDDAGVSPRNPQYGDMVFRTNMKDSYMTGADEERQDPDVADTFPVWRWVHFPPRIGPARPQHEALHDKYFPNEAAFAEVRDSFKGEFDGYNCGCDQIPIDKWTWQKLQRGGAEISAFAENSELVTGAERGRNSERSELDEVMDRPAKRAPLRPGYGLIEAPDIRQQNGYRCGVAALQSVLHLIGQKVSQDALAAELGTTREDGTEPDAIVRVAGDRGLKPTAHQFLSIEDLRRFTDTGKPVLCPIQAHGAKGEINALESGHWVVVIGHGDDFITIQDPARQGGGQLEIPNDKFLIDWRDRDGNGRLYWRFGIVMNGVSQKLAERFGGPGSGVRGHTTMKPPPDSIENYQHGSAEGSLYHPAKEGNGEPTAEIRDAQRTERSAYLERIYGKSGGFENRWPDHDDPGLSDVSKLSYDILRADTPTNKELGPVFHPESGTLQIWSGKNGAVATVKRGKANSIVVDGPVRKVKIGDLDSPEEAAFKIHRAMGSKSPAEIKEKFTKHAEHEDFGGPGSGIKGHRTVSEKMHADPKTAIQAARSGLVDWGTLPANRPLNDNTVQGIDPAEYEARTQALMKAPKEDLKKVRRELSRGYNDAERRFDHKRRDEINAALYAVEDALERGHGVKFAESKGRRS